MKFDRQKIEVEIFFFGVEEPVLFAFPPDGPPTLTPMTLSPFNNGGAGAPGWSPTAAQRLWHQKRALFRGWHARTDKSRRLVDDLLDSSEYFPWYGDYGNASVPKLLYHL